uniref:Uncharacterized protein n=1 Tax=Triticum urartu TaxID=4572 RepID=A0A8R7U5H6_TRIUA
TKISTLLYTEQPGAAWHVHFRPSFPPPGSTRRRPRHRCPGAAYSATPHADPATRGEQDEAGAFHVCALERQTIPLIASGRR